MNKEEFDKKVEEGINRIFDDLQATDWNEMVEASGGTPIQPIAAIPSKDRAKVEEYLQYFKNIAPRGWTVEMRGMQIVITMDKYSQPGPLHDPSTYDNTPNQTPLPEQQEQQVNYSTFIADILEYMEEQGMQINPIPEIILKKDKNEAIDIFGKTAYYQPQDKQLVLYTLGRHPKDVLRSFCHEMIHHIQNIEGRLDVDQIYTSNTQDSEYVDKLEQEAHAKGSYLFRSWEDTRKQQLSTNPLEEESSLKNTKVSRGGRPLVVWRAKKNDREDTGERRSNTFGIYFSEDPESTKIYGDKIKPYYVNLQNPIILKDKNWNLSIITKPTLYGLEKKGHDGAIWLRNGEMYEVVAFTPDQVIPLDIIIDLKELEIGIKEEMEHTDDPKVARQIAIDHLKEDPKYYTKLKKAGLVDVKSLNNEIDNKQKTPPIISEDLKYHFDNKISISENVYRYGSPKYFKVINEARELYKKGYGDWSEEDIEILESDRGKFFKYNGQRLPLDFPMVNEQGEETSWSRDEDKITLQDILELTKDIKIINFPTEKLANIVLNWDNNPEEIERISQVEVSSQYPILIMVDESGKIQWILDGNHRAQKALRSKSETIPAKLIKPSDLNPMAKKIFGLSEAEYKGRDVELNKPKSGGPKKWYVYVRNPKTGKIKKVTYGSPVMTAKWNDPAARKSFAARHQCHKKKDKTKPGYWACRAHKDFGKNVSGRFW